MAKEALLNLLANESALVREGVVYGLSHHLDPVVAPTLRRIAETDPSPGVREAALEVLDQ